LSPFPSATRGTDPVRRFVPLREQPDERLVALARGGSDDAFAEIVRRYQRPLRGYCSRIVDPGRAEDAVQQAFLHALRALRGPDRRELALKAWLFAIARNCAIDLHTGRTTHTFEELDGGAPDAAPSPPRLVEQREEISQLMTGLQRLPDGQRRALLLRELEGRSYEEIGVEIGRTPSGVRQTIFRARTALREAVAVFAPPLWLRALWPAGGAPGRSLEAVAAAGAAIVAVAGTAGLPSPGPAPDGLAGGAREAVVAAAPGTVADPPPVEPPSRGVRPAPARPPRPDTPIWRPPLPGADPPASTGPTPRPTPVKGTPDGPDGGQTPSVPPPGRGQTPSVPGTQIVQPPPSAGGEGEPGEGQTPPPGEGQTPPVSGSSGSGSSSSGSSGSGSSGSGSSGSGSDGSGRRGSSGSGSGGSDSSGSDSSGSGSDGSGSSGSGSSGSGSSGSGSGDDSGGDDR
jgi:RNA polymerase sigma factor (sigma-70 family)